MSSGSRSPEADDALSEVYRMIWRRVFGAHYSLVVPRLTIEEAQAAVLIGMGTDDADARRRAADTLTAAVQRIAAELRQQDENRESDGEPSG